jgi:hypothetical protein
VTLRGNRWRVALILVAMTCALAAHPSAAHAFNPLKPICDAADLASGLLGKACSVTEHAGGLLNSGKQLLGGHLGSALKSILGEGASAAGSGATAALGLAAVGAWVLGGAKFVLHEAAKAVGETTTPHLETSWFSATYWRVAGIAALLTLPFLFAAAVQALTRSDLTLLLRAVLGYLPLAMLAVTVAAPVTILLLSGSDQLSTLVSSATGQPGASVLGQGFGLTGALTLISGSPFFVFFFALLTAAGAMTLWMELLMREAAVYVVVLMLPLAFAALVWPARRVWALRAVELLVALILSKFAIVAVLSLGGAAMDQVGHSITAAVIGLVLVVLAAFSPWVLLRLVPLAEVAGAAAATLRGEARGLAGHANTAALRAEGGEDWAARAVAGMRRVADDALPPLSPGTTAKTGGGPDAPEAQEDGSSPADVAEPATEQSGLDGVLDPGLHGGPDAGLVDGLAAGGGGTPPDGLDPASPPSEPPMGPDAKDRVPERVPGLSDMWQADDLSWRPLTLGTDEGWPPRVWPPASGASRRSGVDGPGEDATGLPPPQESPQETPESSGVPEPMDEARPVLALPPPAELPPPLVPPPPAEPPPPPEPPPDGAA